MVKLNRQVRKFIELHANGEQVLAWAAGSIGKTFGEDGDELLTGVLIVTHTHAVFYKKGIFTEVLKSIALEKISSIDKTIGIIGGKISIGSSKQHIEFSTHDKPRLKHCANAILQVCRNRAIAASNSRNLMTNLAALKVAGHMTWQELDAKQAQLLDIA